MPFLFIFTLCIIFLNNILIKSLIFLSNKVDENLKIWINNRWFEYRESDVILTVDLAIAAIDSPIIIAVIVDRAVSVKQKSVLAILVA